MILYTYNEKHNGVFTYCSYRQIIYSTGGQNTKGKFDMLDDLCTHSTPPEQQIYTEVQ